MEFYNVVKNRKTIRDLKNDSIEKDVLERIIDTAIHAPTNNHLREWAFVLLETAEEKENALQYVKEFLEKQASAKITPNPVTVRQKMYNYAVPRQYSMLYNSGCVILPFFKAAPNFPKVETINALNSFASIWCCVENILLSATAEGLACNIRIPVGDEGAKAACAVNAPEGWIMPCYIAIGYPRENAVVPQQTEKTTDDVIHFGKW